MVEFSKHATMKPDQFTVCEVPTKLSLSLEGSMVSCPLPNVPSCETGARLSDPPLMVRQSPKGQTYSTDT
jgi:hypothetical protein